MGNKKNLNIINNVYIDLKSLEVKELSKHSNNF
jgi:hypothetical protein